MVRISQKQNVTQTKNRKPRSRNRKRMATKNLKPRKNRPRARAPLGMPCGNGWKNNALAAVALASAAAALGAVVLEAALADQALAGAAALDLAAGHRLAAPAAWPVLNREIDSRSVIRIAGASLIRVSSVS